MVGEDLKIGNADEDECSTHAQSSSSRVASVVFLRISAPDAAHVPVPLAGGEEVDHH